MSSETRRLSPNRDLRRVILLALQQGWIVERRNNGHIRWTSPSGYHYYSSSTPSDGRAIRNIKRDLRKQGLTV